MKAIRTHFSALLLTLVALTTLSGCEADDWWATDTLIGNWRVVEVSGYSNYAPGDVWTFDSNGSFYAQGYPDLYEYGYWEVQSRRIIISFDSYGPEVYAYIKQLDDQYMVLDVSDNNLRYTLRLIRNYY